MMKKLAIVFILFSMFSFIPRIFMPVCACAENTTYEIHDIDYLDINENGIIDQEDIYLIEQSIIYGIYSPFELVDLITAYKVLFDVAIQPTQELYCSNLSKTLQNQNIVRNFITSDYPRTLTIYEDKILISFSLVEGNKNLIFKRDYENYDPEDILINYSTGSISVIIHKDFSATIV